MTFEDIRFTEKGYPYAWGIT